MSETPNGKTPPLIAAALILVGILVGVLTRSPGGLIAGGVVAAAGSAPAGYGLWVGMQQKTQASLAMAILTLIGSLAVGALLVVIGLIDWIA
jgi:hypothetical protein